MTSGRRQATPLARLGLIVVAALAVAGCGGSSSSAST
ncbi:MAG: hypothetical protein RJA49_960, partial [Actinomycetota bacterium]